MAAFIPETLDYSIHTASEKTFFNCLKEQLFDDDNYTVFFSVPWVTRDGKNNLRGEADFIICNRKYGFLVVEVKGGFGLTVSNRQFYIEEINGDKRLLKVLPSKQAASNMQYFIKTAEKALNKKLTCVAGYCVAFPNFHIQEDLGTDCPEVLTISINDMSKLKEKIESIFEYWKSKSYNFTNKEHNELVNMLNKEKAFKFSFKSQIQANDKKLNEINRVQNHLLDFIKHKKKAAITGGAGTGKTWIAIKKAISEVQKNKKVLYVCFNRSLAEFLKYKFLNEAPEIDIKTFHGLCEEIIGCEPFKEFYGDPELKGIFDKISKVENIDKYDSIIVDEGQDFTDEWGMVLESLLNDVEQSIFYIFYDEEQDIFGRNSLKNYFADSGYISPMSYQLTENIRNTKQICEWCKKNTGFGNSMNANLVSGVEPTVFEYTDAKNIRKEVGKILYDLTENHGVDPEQIVVLSDRSLPKSVFSDDQSAGNYKITKDEATDKQEVKFKTIQSFKGLESDVVIYLQHSHERMKLNYVGYTRAKYILYVLKLVDNGFDNSI